MRHAQLYTTRMRPGFKVDSASYVSFFYFFIHDDRVPWLCLHRTDLSFSRLVACRIKLIVFLCFFYFRQV